MSYFAGIDYSSHAVDIVLLDEDSGAAKWEHYPLSISATAFDRTRSVRERVPTRGWWDDSSVLAVGIEEPRGYNSGALYRIQGAILATIPAELLVHPLVPSEWRKLVGLPGNASKDDVRQFTHGYVLWESTDACDAYCIALAVSKLVQQEEVAV